MGAGTKKVIAKWLGYETFSNLFTGIWNIFLKNVFISFPRRVSFQHAPINPPSNCSAARGLVF